MEIFDLQYDAASYHLEGKNGVQLNRDVLTDLLNGVPPTVDEARKVLIFWRQQKEVWSSGKILFRLPANKWLWEVSEIKDAK